MKIGLISDTHIPSMGREPPPQVAQAFAGVDLILHAGDIYIQSCIEWLERIAPVQATTSWFGSAREGASRVSVPKVVEVEGHSVGLVHELILTGMSDDVFPGAIETSFPPGRSLPMALQNIFGKAVEIVVFGYTHEAMVELHQGVLLVNPGSPNTVKQVRKLGTVAILELTPERREARIIDLARLEQ
ncbi:MAG: metallophosphoesterase family protein [Chloroflexi bacterium]|nr:metallophosphoesterase family protein [Chloroflexota bacterium]